MPMLRYAVTSIAIVVLSGSAWAQSAPVTAQTLTQLDATAADIAAQIVVLKKTDATLAASVEQSLGDLKDEIAYLRVKLKKDTVTRVEFADLRDRLETLRIKAGAGASSKVSAQKPGEAIERVYTVAVGTQMDVRLQTTLNSGTAKVEQRFEALTLSDVVMGADVVIPSGTLVRGFVSSVRVAGRIERKGSLTLSFDEIIFNQRPSRLRASITQAIDGKSGADAARIGTGAAVGAIIGGLLGGGKGALIGVLVGGGSTIASTEGADVDLPSGTVLRLRIDQPLEVTVVR